MSRKPRIHYEGALYHVIIRGNNREYIFKEELWKKQYLEVIIRYKQKYKFKLYAYVIMDNHAHLLIEVSHVPLAKVMQCIQQVFTQTFNRNNGRTGHVFEQRYKSILCDKEQYLLMLIRYIHQNPLRAGIEKGLDYQWSSYKEYIDEKRNDLADVQFPLSLFDNRLDLFTQFVNEEDVEIKKKSTREFSEDIDEYDYMKNQHSDEITMDLETIIVKVCELLEVDVIQLDKHTRLREVAKARQLIAYIALKNPHIKQRQIAERFNQKPNSISMMLSKVDIGKKCSGIIDKIVI